MTVPCFFSLLCWWVNNAKVYNLGHFAIILLISWHDFRNYDKLVCIQILKKYVKLVLVFSKSKYYDNFVNHYVLQVWYMYFLKISTNSKSILECESFTSTVQVGECEQNDKTIHCVNGYTKRIQSHMGRKEGGRLFFSCLANFLVVSRLHLYFQTLTLHLEQDIL